MSASPTVFVCGATGTQGLAACRHLRALNWPVHATVRSSSSPAAQTLAALGVSLTVGSWDDVDALTTALTGCTKLFLNMIPTFTDLGAELVQAKRILTLAAAAGVTQVVYSSSMIVNKPELVETITPGSIVAQVMHSKKAIEAAVLAAGFRHATILRGGFFMQNFLAPKTAMYPGLVETRVWTTAITAETLTPMIDADDVSAAAVAAFQDPEKWSGQDVTLAAEKLTAGEIMKRLSKATGKEFKAAFLSEEEIKAQRAFNPFIEGQLVQRMQVNLVDLEEARSWGVPMVTFEEFLEKEKKTLMETYD